MKPSGRHRKRKASCRSLRKRRRPLPQRCRRPQPVAPVAPAATVVIPSGTQPAATQVAPPASGTPTAATPAGTGPTATPGPAASPAPSAPLSSPIAVYDGPFGLRQAERLLWRAGFGPRPGQAAALAAGGLGAAVASLTRPASLALEGRAPTVDGEPLDPYSTWGHDHLWWLDRMVRTRAPLTERMTLVWHDWFSTSDAGVGSKLFMLEQNDLFRTQSLGNFKQLVRGVTQDRAMQVWLSALDNVKGAINENYARELMELFTLGADRGAYTESDVRELARALSGFDADWNPDKGLVNFRWDAKRADRGAKTVFGQTGAFGWEDACRLVVEHPLHPTFLVEKLWGYFVADGLPTAKRDALAALYVDGGYEVRPVLEAILQSPELYAGAALVKPPVVLNAGMLRASGQTLTEDWWVWMDANAGQQLFYPPDVSGWDDARWLDTNTMAGRWQLVNGVLGVQNVEPSGDYRAETAAQAFATARTSLGDPPLSTATEAAIARWAVDCLPAESDGWQRAQRFNALRQLIAMSPDHQTS